MKFKRIPAALMLIILVSCSAPAPDDALIPGQWRGVIELPEGQLPFQLEVPNTPDEGVHAWLINGAERVPIEHLSISDGEVLIEFPAFNNRIFGKLENGKLEGTLELIKRHGKRQHMPLTLTSGQSHRFFESSVDVNADFGGRWRVDFEDGEGNTSIAVADFQQQNGKVTGTFRTPTGDYRFLAGEVNDRSLYLSTFDAAHAFLFTAIMAADGTVTGDFWSGTEWHEGWVAVRDASASLPDPNQLTKITDQSKPFYVSFPDTDGNLVSSTDERFQDKILIVALAGSWCPNCHDEAAFLAPFYRKYRDQGVEVLGLMYEHLDDTEEAAEQVRRFAHKFDIDYTLLVAGSSDKSKASESLPMLNKVIAYPTMIVLDRSGEVRRIHTGFDGPGTGDVYEQFRTEFSHFIEQLISEEKS